MMLTLNGYPKYGITDDGQVIGKNGQPKKLYTDKIGYTRVTLYSKGKPKLLMVHRLVAIMFVPNPYTKGFVNHKNGIKSDNRAENLEWVTREENMRHSVDVLGNVPWNKGKKGVYSDETRTKMGAARKGKAPWNKKDALAEGKSIESYLETL